MFTEKFDRVFSSLTMADFRLQITSEKLCFLYVNALISLSIFDLIWCNNEVYDYESGELLEILGYICLEFCDFFFLFVSFVLTSVSTSIMEKARDLFSVSVITLCRGEGRIEESLHMISNEV